MIAEIAAEAEAIMRKVITRVIQRELTEPRKPGSTRHPVRPLPRVLEAWEFAVIPNLW
jgi:hypothetical protein